MYEERAKKLGELTYQRRVKEEKEMARLKVKYSLIIAGKSEAE